MSASALLVCDRLLSSPQGARRVVLVAGESGSGKTTLAGEVVRELARRDLTARVLYLDDYFELPPDENHARRARDLAWVGPSEVRLDALSRDVGLFLAGATSLEVPTLVPSRDRFEPKRLDLSGCDVLVVEGTYALLVEAPGLCVFVEGTYLDTEPDRRARARDRIDAWTPKILAIEHRVLLAHRDRADVLIPRTRGAE